MSKELTASGGHYLRRLKDTISVAIHWAKKDAQAWSTGYHAIALVAAICGIDLQEWTLSHGTTRLDDRGVRRGVLPYDELLAMLSDDVLIREFFPRGGTAGECEAVGELYANGSGWTPEHWQQCKERHW